MVAILPPTLVSGIIEPLHVDIGVVWDSGTVVIDSGSVFSLMRLSLRRWRGGGHEGC